MSLYLSWSELYCVRLFMSVDILLLTLCTFQTNNNYSASIRHVHTLHKKNLTVFTCFQTPCQGYKQKCKWSMLCPADLATVHEWWVSISACLFRDQSSEQIKKYMYCIHMRLIKCSYTCLDMQKLHSSMEHTWRCHLTPQQYNNYSPFSISL